MRSRPRSRFVSVPHRGLGPAPIVFPVPRPRLYRPHIYIYRFVFFFFTFKKKCISIVSVSLSAEPLKKYIITNNPSLHKPYVPVFIYFFIYFSFHSHAICQIINARMGNSKTDHYKIIEHTVHNTHPRYTYIHYNIYGSLL